MSDKKIVVPSKMLTAAWVAVGEKMRESVAAGKTVAELHVARIALEAALRWLSENPIVPTSDQAMLMRDLAIETSSIYEMTTPTGASESAVCAQWQRIMFLAPEPQEPNDGTVENFNGTDRPVAIWWQGKRWPIATIADEETVGESRRIDEPPAIDHRWNVRYFAGGRMEVCRGDHEKSEGCQWETWTPEVQDEIKDLLFDSDYRPSVALSINERIEEAYLRGQQSKEKV